MPADPNRVESVFHRILELPPAERAAFLAAECGDDAELRARVERLLAAHAELDEPAHTATYRPDQPTAAHDEPNPHIEDHTPQPDAGTVISGRYKLIEEIGEGGMGSVWMAQQTEPVKRMVAVKLIKAGMDSKAVLARFEAERQALALMDHPNIAKVHDAGATPDGRPFFVMELVKGVPITKFCDDHKLTPKERLELFVPVCQAIQHAHQKGVIHRDIKPSNVLVALYDDRPVPKVIDFGVAKAAGQPLTEKTLVTGFGAVVGTPEYMSPEQASFNNLDIDTRSDVYALGVLLYELLAGSPPFSRTELEKVGLLEIFRVVREVEPPRPSAKLSTADALPSLSANRGTEPKRLTALLRGELDWIVMKALEKDRIRRYETANGFAADVQRYLAGEPVQAVPPSAGYRFKKFLKRNKGPVVAASLVFLAIVAGTAVSLAFAYQSEQNASDARKAQKDSDENAELAQRNEGVAKTNESKARAEADLARHMTYITRMGRGSDALRSGNAAQVRAALEETRPKPGQPDGRGWEWHCLDNLVNRPVTRFRYHVPGQGVFSAPIVSPDGRLIAMCEPWRAVGDGPVPFGTRESGRLRIMDPIAPGRWVIDQKVEFDINSSGTAVSSSAGLVVRGCGSDVQTIDRKAGAPVRKWKLEHPLAGSRMHVPQVIGGLEIPLPNCVLDPSGRLALVLTVPLPKGDPNFDLRQDADVVEVWDSSTVTRVFRYTPAADLYFTSMLLGPGGKSLVVLCMPAATRDDFIAPGPRGLPRRAGRLEAWDVDSGKKLWQLDEPRGDPAWPAAFSPDGKRVYAVRGKQVFVRDAATGADVERLPLLPADVTALAVSADGLTVAAGDTTGAVSLIDAAVDFPVERLQTHEGAVYGLAFRADPPALVSVSDDGYIQSYDLARRSLRRLPPAPGRRSDLVSPDGNYALTRLRLGKANSLPAVVELGTGREVLSFPERPEPGQEFHVFTAFTPDSRSFLTTVREAPPRAEKGEGIQRGPSSPLRLVKWGLGSGRPEWVVALTGPQGEHTSFVGFTADGRSFLTRTLQQPPRLTRRSVATGSPEWEVLFPHPDKLDRKSGVSARYLFSPDLSRVVWFVPPVVEYSPPGQAQGVVNTARLITPAEVHAWDLSADGTFTHRLSHTLTWYFAADETAIAAAGEDESPRVVSLEGDTLLVGNLWNAQVFDLATGRASAVCRGERMAPAEVTSPLAVTADQSRLFAVGGRGGVKYLAAWDTRTGEEVARLPVPSGSHEFTHFQIRVTGEKVLLESSQGKNRYVVEFDGTPGAGAVKR